MLHKVNLSIVKIRLLYFLSEIWSPKNILFWGIIYTHNTLKVSGKFYTKINQLGHYWHFGQENSLLWGTSLCMGRHLSVFLASHLPLKLTALFPWVVTIKNVSSHCQMSHGGHNHSHHFSTLMCLQWLNLGWHMTGKFHPPSLYF